MNALRKWRRTRELTIETMAERLGISVGSLSRIERDEQWPDRKFFEAVVELTNGEVTANDFVAQPAPSAEEATP